MQGRLGKILYWLPRGLGILFALFISLFALDVFNEGMSWRAWGGFFIHLIPVYILILVLLLAWRWEWVGVVFYPLLAFAYLISMPHFPFSVYVLIVGPLFLLSLLFLVHQFHVRKNAAN